MTVEITYHDNRGRMTAMWLEIKTSKEKDIQRDSRLHIFGGDCGSYRADPRQ